MRTRIQMYLGSDDTEGIYQALKEIINNATDEAMAGYGDRIEITLDEHSNRIEVRDYGRGVPFGTKDGKNVLVAIYTESHTGGKFDKNAYKNSSGLNGIGGTAVCMSSSYFNVRSIRDGMVAEARFEEGNLTNYLEQSLKDSGIPKEKAKDGTLIVFRPDEKVFINAAEGFSYERICQEIKNISFLNSGIHFVVATTEGKSVEYYSENGIADFIKDKVESPLMKKPILAQVKDEQDEVEIAFMWSGDAAQSYVFVNGLFCPGGGTPITGAKQKITTKIKSLTGETFDPEIIRRGLVYAINCRVANPSFEGQTKNKINNSNLRTLAAQAFDAALEEFARTPDFNVIIEMIRKYQKAERAADKARQEALNHQKKYQELSKRKIAFIDKLSDAETLGPDSILCVVEGNSAGNAAADGRDTKKYGIMRLRGKMINGLKEEDDQKYFDNKEIELLLYSLGINPDNYDPTKLRYGKIAICVDSDDDGYHIALLILANLHRLCPQFLRENRVFWLRAPLFIEQDKDGNPLSCYYSDEEFDKARSKVRGVVKRVKGLGQLNERDLRATMFSTTGNQRMDQIMFSDEGLQQLCKLMGPDIQPRKDFVFSQIDFSKYGAV